MPARFKEQGDFEELDDDEPTSYFDRPPGPVPPTQLRPHQVLLPAPDLNTSFIVPAWSGDDEPKGWTYESGFIDNARLTKLNAHFTYLIRSGTTRMRVSVRWDPDELRPKAFAWNEQGDPGWSHVMRVDTAAIERSSLLRVARFLDLHAMLTTSMNPETLDRILLLSGIGYPKRRDAETQRRQAPNGLAGETRPAAGES